jgi:hypothetical protein
MFRYLVLGLCLVMAGCGNKAAEQMRGGVVEEWAELRALDDSLIGVGMNASMENWRGSQSEINESAMNTVIDAFAASPPPSGYNADKKEAVVTAYRDLIAAAKADTNAFAEKYKALMNTLKELRPAVQGP